MTRERYITAAELAGAMGLSRATVTRWTREGMPSETWGLHVRRYLLSQALEWARDRAGPDSIGSDNPAPGRGNATEPDTTRR